MKFYPQRRQRGFSLVEVTLALGVLAFAMVPVLGLLPMGMNLFHGAIDTSVGTQIAQRVLNDARQTDFDQLVPSSQNDRYFDEQGNEVEKAEKARGIYHVNLFVAEATGLPGAASNPYLATVTVQVANDPGHRSDAMAPGLPWGAMPGVAMSTYSANVARSR